MHSYEIKQKLYLFKRKNKTHLHYETGCVIEQMSLEFIFIIKILFKY